MQKNLSVPHTPGGMRLLSFLKERLPNTTKELKWLVEHNRCSVNGAIERFCSTRLFGGERVRITFSGKTPPSFDSQRIVFQDEALLIYNKPPALTAETIAQAGGLKLVHRLDRDTTGLLLLAKSEASQEKIEEHFRLHKVEKEYLAIVSPAPSESEGVIDLRIEVKARREGALIMEVVKKGGKKSRTQWSLLKTREEYALLSCKPVTGRTHQIRLHLAAIGSPIYGDCDYGSRENRTLSLRPLLHAYRISFPHPITNEIFSWEIAPPKDFLLKPTE